jgi:hypothetical protein
MDDTGSKEPEGSNTATPGKRSNRARPEKLQQKVLALVRKHYSGGEGERFGPTLAAEHLSEEHGIELDAETLRRWMLKAGLWSRVRKSKRYRSRRQRKAHFGELLQLDGSFHRWLEDRAEQGCLINLVDDATGMAVAQFAEEETTWAVADVLRKWVERNGIPRAIYTDWKSVYHAKPEQEGSERQRSQFGHVRPARHRIDRGQLAAGQGTSGAASRHASRPAGEETPAAGNRYQRKLGYSGSDIPFAPYLPQLRHLPSRQP